MKPTITILFKFIFCFLLLIFEDTYAQPSWQPLDSDDANQPYALGTNGTAVAVHPLTEEVYLAYNAFGLDSQGFVSKFNSITGLWEDIEGSFSQGTANNLSMVFDSNGVLYIGFRDLANGNRATVKKLNNNTSQWDTVGLVGFSSGMASHTSLAVDSTNAVYICYGDSSLDGKAIVKKFDGINWVNVGAAGFTSTSANNISIAIGTDDTVYIGYSAWYSGQMKATVMKFADTVWQVLGTPGFTSGGTSNTKVAVNPITDVPYIAYSDFSSGYRANVKKFNGSSWEDVGVAGFSQSLVNRICFAISSNGTPFIGYEESNKAKMMRFNGSDWEAVGGTEGFSIGAISFTDIAIEGNTPYMSFTDIANSSKATLMKFNGDEWICLGGTMGFSKVATVSSTAPPKASELLITEEGAPYVGYIEDSNDNYITVKKYNDILQEWVTVGMPAFSQAKALNLSMAAYQNTLYVAYTQQFPYKVTVERFNGAVWETVGLPAFTSGGARKVAITISASGVPYIIFIDESNFNRATVMRFNGATWETVGTAGFSASSINDPVIILNAEDVPYVGFDEYGSGVVMKFNGISWESVGGVFNNFQVNDNNIAIGPDNYLYTAYTDGNTGKVAVKKFNGTGWELVGDAGISDGLVSYTKLAIKSDGQLYVSYIDQADDWKATVIRYNGIDWVPVGNSGISAGPAYDLDLAINGEEAIISYSSPCTYAKLIDITCNTPLPSASSQSFCSTATVAELVAEGENIQWYSTEEFGSPLDDDTPLTSGIYYVAQMQNDCIGSRLAVNVIVTDTETPEGMQQQVIINNEGGNATLEDLIVTGTNIQWYDSEGNILSMDTILITETTYFATQTIDGCESSALAVTVELLLNSTSFNDINFLYYPNPVSNKLHITSGSNITHVEIYTLYGQKLATHIWDAKEGDLEMAHLSEGVYLVCVYSEVGAKNVKIIKGV